jgi:replicative DNA helicase
VIEQKELRRSRTQSQAPPHNLEAEESVLGASMLSREAAGLVVDHLEDSDFYRPSNSEIFRAMTELYVRGQPIDPVTVGEELQKRGSLEENGGRAYLATLIHSVPTPGSALHYANIVAETAVLRRLVEAGQSITQLGLAHSESSEQALGQAQDIVFGLSNNRTSKDFRPLSAVLSESMEIVERLYENGAKVTGLATGFEDLDMITTGLQPASLVMVAARPGHGKSSLALGIAHEVAVQRQEPVAFFSLEMSETELAQRLICMEAKIDSSKLRRGELHDSDWGRISDSLGRLGDAPLHIADTPNLTIMEMRAKCRRLQARRELALVVVDYLQLMTPIRRNDNRVQEVSEISRSLKILARELNVPVVALSQLSRGVETRVDKRPLLADLRDSGALEADADIVLFIYRDEVYNPESKDRGVAEINIAKHRNGPLGRVKLAFVDRYASFANLELAE